MTTVEFPLIPDQAPVRFRFTIPTTRQLERSAGVGIEFMRLRGQTVEAITLMTCYALKSENPRMTEDKAADLIQNFIDGGGNVAELTTALVEALNASGVYGRVGKKADADTGLGPGDENPPTTPETVM